ncbi:MAG: hypothetical protein ACLP74_03820 [Thermoplasmata archaeon]
MPYAEDRVARLYYDRGCGSCSFFARAAEGTSHQRLVAVPLDAPDAERDLGDLADGVRYGSAHLVTGAGRETGSDIVTPLARLVLGERVARVYGRVPFLDRSFRRVYIRFWNYRRTRGCAAATFS